MLYYLQAKRTRLKLIKQLEKSKAHKSTLLKHLQNVPMEKERETLLKQVIYNRKSKTSMLFLFLFSFLR